MKLQALRRKIDLIDREIVRLLNLRTRHAVRIGRIKQAEDIPVFVPARERRLLDRLRRLNRGPLPHASLLHIYREIMSAARAIEGGLDVACTASSLAAARAKFGDSVHYVRCTSASAALKEARRRDGLVVLPAGANKGPAIDEFECGGKKYVVLSVAR